jgi:hypothetical protein
VHSGKVDACEAKVALRFNVSTLAKQSLERAKTKNRETHERSCQRFSWPVLQLLNGIHNILGA